MAKKMRKKIPIASPDWIPDIDFFKKAFEEFEKCKETEYEKVIGEYVRIFNAFPFHFMQHAKKGDLDTRKFYRVLKCEDAEKCGKNKLTSFSHPPEGNCPAGRFNIINFPLLYAVDLEHTAIEEKKIKCGEYFYLSEWEFEKGIELLYIFLFDEKYIDITKYPNGTKDMEKRFDDSLSEYPEEKRNSVKFYSKKLTDLALTDPHNSKTSALGHYYIGSQPNKSNPLLGYIAYPSNAKKKDGYNFAFNPELLKRGLLKCSSVQKIKLVNHSIIESNIEKIETAVIDYDKVIWRKFELKLVSAIFYDEESIVSLGFCEDNNEYAYFPNTNKSVKEFIYSTFYKMISDAITEQAKKNKKVRLGYYFQPIPKSVKLIIDDIEFKKIKFQIQYSYWNV